MKLLLLVALVATLAISGIYSQECSSETCRLPNCRCGSLVLDKDIPINETPQLVMLTFDDAVTAQIYDLVMPAIDGRVNPDGCPAQITYFHSHEYTDYTKVHHLWANGHELGLHSVSHTPYVNYWNQISLENMTAEFGDQRQIVSHFAQIDIDDIKGMRVPLLELSGDISYKALRDVGLTYDSSWPTQAHFSGMFPYTLDYPSIQDCPLGRCPTSLIPGVWVIPMLMWDDIEGVKCSFIDACPTIPDSEDTEGMLHWMKMNFHRVYDSTRAPFPIYMHAAWLLRHENHLNVYSQFLDYILSLGDAYLVSSQRVIEYMRNPRRLTQQGRQIFDACQTKHENSCTSPKTCALLREDVNQERWMATCAECPAVFPWVNNPFGQR
jgi:hypothetical protein